VKNENLKVTIDCIAIPTISRELGDLAVLFACWRLFHRNEKVSERLLITLPNAHDQALLDNINRLASILEIDRLFELINVEFLDIPLDEDIYIKHGQKWAGKIPRLGLKSGPNSQFFRTLRCARSNEFTFLNETDVFPLNSTWHRDLSQSLRVNKDWVLGSHYCGDTTLGVDIISHINGAAVYATGNHDFQKFCTEIWEPGIAEMCKKMPDTAYDIWLSRLQHKYSREPELWAQKGRSYQRLITDAISRFTGTEYIANLTLPSDLKEINELKNKGYSIVHGKHFQSHALHNAINQARQMHGDVLSKVQVYAILSRTGNNAALAGLMLDQSSLLTSKFAARQKAQEIKDSNMDPLASLQSHMNDNTQEVDTNAVLMDSGSLPIKLFARLSEISIFTRSYVGDKSLLPDLYKSIEANFNEAAEAILVVESQDLEQIKSFVPNWVRIETEEKFTAGTIQHKYTKLTADTFSSKDWIFHIDSDTVVTAPISKNYLVTEGKPILEIASYESLKKHQDSDSFKSYMKKYMLENHLQSEIEKELDKAGVHNKPEWFKDNLDTWINNNYDRWFSSWFPRWKYAFGLDLWQEGTSYAFGTTILYEFSQKPIKLYPREIYKVCRDHIRHIHGKDLKEFISTRVGKQSLNTERSRYFSDLNFIGACLFYYAREHVHWVRTDIEGFDYRPTLLNQRISYDILKSKR